ncbi:polysaccharide deacetylase [Sphingomonas sp.]|uniref:polysaccharide deacetylase n=1 Tax=Sphingomonas sp. TaxID=28214 RepID=UPI002CADBCEE|nr:polysaccharide deacetylase [Sphingomonas sp.]HTG39569.1 polysaccharide deacetylase [Sphingomonas sp.]
MTPVFLTVDTELMWRHHAARRPLDEQVARSIDPAGVGIGYQLDMLARHDLKACFFVDPMPAAIHGPDVVKRIVAPILAAGQEVQLHLHPNWAGAVAGDGGAAHGVFELVDLNRAGQQALLAQAIDWLVAAGCERPIAFRAGSYAANDDTIDALVALGLDYDSSHNGSAHPWPSGLSLPADSIAPMLHRGLIECPVTLIEEAPGRLRHFQICALSTVEMRDALDHAARHDHAAVTIVSHGFELATRAGTAPNAVHVRRFEALCAMLAERRLALPTCWYRDRPALVLGQADRPLPPRRTRTAMRRVEQLWSNLVAERAR